MAKREVVLGLVWHSVNSDNLGVGALTASHLALLDGICARLGATPRYLVVGADDPRTPYIARPDLALAPIRTKRLLKPVGGIGGALAGCDLVIDIGAGDSFADIYGLRRAILMQATKALTLLAGRPLVLAPQTIGPFERGWLRAGARMLMNRARLVATRDALSTEALDAIGVTAPRLEATDVALRLPWDAPAQPSEDGKVRVGLNVSGLLFNGGYTQDNMFGLAADHPALIRALIADFAARPEVELTLVGHVISERQPVEDDQRTAEALAAEFPGVAVAPAFGHPSEAKSFIAGLDFFMGARMHACIAAFSSGVPVLPMAYSRKFAGLFGSLGYDALTDLRADDAETVLRRAREAYETREALREQARTSLEEGLSRLARYEAALEALIREAMG